MMIRLLILVIGFVLCAVVSCTSNHSASTDIPRNILAEEAFTPDDPYFFYDPANPLHPGQWNIVNQAPGSIHYPESVAANGHRTADVTITNAGLDANILPVWKAGYTGRGIIIGILDDGVEFGHPDLDIASELSTGMDSKGIVPGQTGAHRKDSDSHGTTVAGMANVISATALSGSFNRIAASVPGSPSLHWRPEYSAAGLDLVAEAD